MLSICKISVLITKKLALKSGESVGLIKNEKSHEIQWIEYVQYW